MEEEIRISDFNKVAYIMYYLESVNYKLCMDNNRVYFIFTDKRVLDLLLDFKESKLGSRPSYVDLGDYLNILNTVKKVVTAYKKEKVDDDNGRL